MRTIYYTLLFLTILITSCDTNTSKNVEKTKDSVISTADKPEFVESEVVKPICKTYEKDDFREEFTCLYFEKFSYDEYVKQIGSVDNCDRFYSDLKNKNNTICEKYKCSKEELRELCIDQFSYEDDTIDKRNNCVEQKCKRNKFRSQCSNYEEVCIEAVILGCLSKSDLAPTDFNIRSCVVSNSKLIQKECTTEACITDEVETCADIECEIKPTEEYISKCMEKEKDVCTTQIRTRLE